MLSARLEQFDTKLEPLLWESSVGLTLDTEVEAGGGLGGVELTGSGSTDLGEVSASG